MIGHSRLSIRGDQAKSEGLRQEIQKPFNCCQTAVFRKNSITKAKTLNDTLNFAMVNV